MKIRVEPINGWGWSYRNGKEKAVPPPFSLEAVVEENHGFKTALGRLNQPSHPVASMWVFLSPIIAGNEWSFSHLCAFNDQPSMPGDGETILDNESKANVLGKVIAAADVTGFARVEIDLTPE
jgi:hypothetical protein